MKYFIVITILLFSLSHAEVVSQKDVGKEYKRDLTRQQMLREAKHLDIRYKDALSRLDNWKFKKEELLGEFRKRNRDQDVSFGAGDAYGKSRAKKRKAEYNRSLAEQENRIKERVADVEGKLLELKEEFLFRFAVPLTTVEMHGGRAPIISDKKLKVSMLKSYIGESNAWKKCRERVSEFDSVQSVASSISKLFPEVNLTKVTIIRKSEQNMMQMQKHLDKYIAIDEDYRMKYGLSIEDDVRAKAILRNINNY